METKHVPHENTALKLQVSERAHSGALSPMKFERQTKLKPHIKIQIFFHESGNLLCGHLEEIDQQNQCAVCKGTILVHRRQISLSSDTNSSVVNCSQQKRESIFEKNPRFRG